jgi:hypothetical protein
MDILVPAEFAAAVSSALVRLQYLYPSYAFQTEGERIVVTGVEPERLPEMQREITYALYREKIYADGLPMRRRLYERLFG